MAWDRKLQWNRSGTSIITRFPHFKLILWFIPSTHIKSPSNYSIFSQSTSNALLYLSLNACGIYVVVDCESFEYGCWQALLYRQGLERANNKLTCWRSRQVLCQNSQIKGEMFQNSDVDGETYFVYALWIHIWANVSTSSAYICSIRISPTPCKLPYPS